MARGRIVSTSIATDMRLNTLSVEAEYLFLKTIPHLDRDGLIIGDYPVLWATVAIRRPQFLPRMEEIVAEWQSSLDPDTGLGLVIRYQTKEGPVIFFPGFRKNNPIQYNREIASRFAPPPGWHRTEKGLERDAPKPPASPEQSKNGSGSSPETRQSDSRVTLESDQSDASNSLEACKSFTSYKKLREVKLIPQAVEKNVTSDDGWEEIASLPPSVDGKPLVAAGSTEGAVLRALANIAEHPEALEWLKASGGDQRLALALADFCELFKRVPPVDFRTRKRWAHGMGLCATEVGYDLLRPLMAMIATRHFANDKGFDFSISDPHSIYNTMLRLRDEERARPTPTQASEQEHADREELQGTLLDQTVSEQEREEARAAFQQQRAAWANRKKLSRSGTDG